MKMIHWTPQKKRKIAMEVISGAMEFKDACEFYDLSTEELNGWVWRVNADEPLKLSYRRLA